jgi:YbbR domain-containing protein
MLKILKLFVRFFTVEPARKILALILAFGLWLFVAIDGTYNYEREISINYKNLPDTYIITDSIPRLRVSFNGKGRFLFGIWIKPPVAECNLSEVVPGKNVISTKDFVVPVKDVSINYGLRFVNVEVDEKITKPVKLSIPLKGALKGGFSIAAIELLDTILVTGQRKILQKLNEVKVESLDVKNQSATFERTLKFEPISGLVRFSSEDVSVRVLIDSSARKLFMNVSLSVVRNSGQRTWISVQEIDTVIVLGARSRLNDLKKEDVSARIKTTDLVNGEYFLSPEIVLPEFMTPVHISPQRLRVLVY